MLRRVLIGRTKWLFASIVFATIVGAPARTGALVFFTFTSTGVTCGGCDTPFSQPATVGEPVRSLRGAKWVQSSVNGTTYAGGLKGGDTVNFHLDLREFNTQTGTTHFLFIFTAVISGGKSGLLHVRDTSPGAKGEIKMIAMPAQTVGTETGLTEQVYRTPGADFTLSPDGTDGAGTSSDPLPWDHPINNPIIDIALTMSGLGPKATWGISTVIAGAHRLPCQCEAGAPQKLTPGCSQFAGDSNACCVPLNAGDVQSSLPKLYCPSDLSSASSNSCGKPQAKAWTCPAVLDDFFYTCHAALSGSATCTADAECATGQFCDGGTSSGCHPVVDGLGVCAQIHGLDPHPLDFSCSVTGALGTEGTYLCTNPSLPHPGIDAGSCSFVAKICQ